MKTQSLPRVLIIDDDERIGTHLTALLKKKYEVAVAKGSGQALVDDTHLIAPSFRPHVAVVDLRLVQGKTTDFRGLELIESLRSACCILYSAYLTPEVALEALNKYDVKRWASKREPAKLLEAIDQAAEEYCASVGGPVVHNTGPGSSHIMEMLFANKGVLPPEMVDDVLLRLFPHALKLLIEPMDSAVITPVTSRISWGRSVVLKITPDKLQPVVVKFGPAERILEEKHNYDDFVEGRLGGNFHAQLKDVITFWDLGCAAYTFLGTQLRGLPSFRVFYQRHKKSKKSTPRKILEPLTHFFDEVWSSQYENYKTSDEYAQMMGSEETPIQFPNLFQLYDRSLELESRLGRLEHVELPKDYPELSTYSRNPAQWVNKHIGDSLVSSARIAVTHGDLHSDNLFADKNHAWAIDFERTGWSHALRDFVELEIDIISRLIAEDRRPDLSQYLVFFSILTEPEFPAPAMKPAKLAPTEVESVFPSAGFIPTDSGFFKALSVIAGLRMLASVKTNYKDVREYVWALLLTSLFVATLHTENDEQVQKRTRMMLLASVLIERLRNWERQWPPPDWPLAEFELAMRTK